MRMRRRRPCHRLHSPARVVRRGVAAALRHRRFGYRLVLEGDHRVEHVRVVDGADGGGVLVTN